MKRFAHFAYMFAAAFAVSGCAGDPPARTDERVLRKPMEAVASTDPIRCTSSYAARVAQLLYEPVLCVDYYARPYKVRPALCDMPEVSPDGLEYRFKIRPGSRFAPDPCFGTGPDGRPRGREITAEDAAYTLKRLADPANSSPGRWVAADIADVRAVGEKEFKILLKRPLHHFLWLMTMQYTGVVPREAVEKYGADFESHPVPSGPYSLELWQRNHRMSFRRNPEWRGWSDGSAASLHPDGTPVTEEEGRPFDRIEYLAVADAVTQWLLFLKGEINFLGKISNDNWDAVIEPDGGIAPELEEAGIALHSNTAMETCYIAFNMDDPVVGKNRALRRALTCAFDFERWRTVQNNRVTEANGPVPACVAEDRLDTPSPWRFDIEKAKRLLEEAGYPGGIDPKTGKRLELTLALSTSQDARQNAELLADFCSKIGVKLEPNYMTWTAFLKANSERRNQMFTMIWVGDYPDVENFLMLFYGKNASPGPNRCNFSNPEFDAAYEEATAARDPAARRRAWLRAQEILRSECPWISLGYTKNYALSRPDVLGYKAGDFPYGEEIHMRSANGAPRRAGGKED